MTSEFALDLHHTDPSCDARAATLHTPHGHVDLPAFMPVGTQGAVKGLTIEQVRATGSQMILGNTYHLALRPGEEIVAELGGLHRFMGWEGPILTDSGGFQIFSLAQMTKITDRSVTFQSHIDGRAVELSPERAIEIQEALGSDVAMVLDHVVALPATREKVSEAMRRTIDWAARCRAAHSRGDQALFAIVQGGLDLGLRRACAAELVAMDFPGYAIGGLSVGESIDEMERVLAATVPLLPADRPRYLMGVGRPQDLLNAVSHGVDMFDCVLPTRNGRNAMAFTDSGSLRLRNERFRRDPRPLETDCPCPACRHSRAYLRHLFMAKEMLGPILLTLHNLTYYQRLMSRAREAIRRGELAAFRAERVRQWVADDDE